MTVNLIRFDDTGSPTRLLPIAAERLCREELLIQRGQLLQLRADLVAVAEDESARPDAAKLTRLEASAQLGAIETRLASVDAALARMRSGGFGICGGCGDPIPEERLRALPDAEFCVPCCQDRKRSR